MSSVNVSIVHKLTGEIVAIGHSHASVDGVELEGIAIAGSDEAVITANVDEESISEMYRTHIVAGQELRARERPDRE